jgi:tryptophanyl-tRNA synthetase
MRERRAKYESNMSLVREALDHGSKRARVIAQETMAMVRDALDLDYLHNTPAQRGSTRTS